MEKAADEKTCRTQNQTSQNEDEIFFMPKDEALSWHELDFISKSLCALQNVRLEKSSKNVKKIKDTEVEKIESNLENTFLIKKTQLLMSSLFENKNSTAIFFMPKATFDFFSLVQGNTALCEISLDEIKRINFAVKEIECEDKKNAEFTFMKNRLSKKMDTLQKYLQEGNLVKPVPIQAELKSLKDFIQKKSL